VDDYLPLHFHSICNWNLNFQIMCSLSPISYSTVPLAIFVYNLFVHVYGRKDIYCVKKASLSVSCWH
jgi:hypothetical protein